MNPNSALRWLPVVERLGMPSPRTEVVEFDFMESLGILDGRDDVDLPWEALERAYSRVAFPSWRHPVFVRTDLASAKHAGPRAYKVEDPTQLRRVIAATVEDNAMKGLDPKAFLFREWLYLEAPFTAFGGHPIAREWRLFVNPDGKIDQAYFYWPQDAIRDPSDEDWEKKLTNLSLVPPPVEVREMASEVVAAIGDEPWSVDFAMSDSGKWWLIDMALARCSWRPS